MRRAPATRRRSERWSPTALIVAAGNGDVAMLEMLLRAGADTRLRDHDGNTAQAWAAHGNHAEAVRLLREWAGSSDAVKYRRSHSAPAPRHAMPWRRHRSSD